LILSEKMENIYLFAGILLYIVTVIDIIQTTISMQGGGWLTGRLSNMFWKRLEKEITGSCQIYPACENSDFMGNTFIGEFFFNINFQS